MDAGEEHQRFRLVVSKPGIRDIAAFLFARGVRFGEAGDRDETPVLDAEPSFPMRKIEVPDVGRAAIRLHADQFFKIVGLTLGLELLGSGFGRLLQGEAGGRAGPSARARAASFRRPCCGRWAPSGRGSSCSDPVMASVCDLSRCLLYASKPICAGSRKKGSSPIRAVLKWTGQRHVARRKRLHRHLQVNPLGWDGTIVRFPAQALTQAVPRRSEDVRSHWWRQRQPAQNPQSSGEA